MPYKLNWEHSGITFIYSGRVTSLDAIESNQQFYSDPRSDEVKFQIADFLNTEELSIDTDAIHMVAHMDDVHFGFSVNHPFNIIKIAFIGKKEMIKSIQKLYSEVLFETDSKLEANYFNDYESARQWLGIS